MTNPIFPGLGLCGEKLGSGRGKRCDGCRTVQAAKALLELRGELPTIEGWITGTRDAGGNVELLFTPVRVGPS